MASRLAESCQQEECQILLVPLDRDEYDTLLARWMENGMFFLFQNHSQSGKQDQEDEEAPKKNTIQ